MLIDSDLVRVLRVCSEMKMNMRDLCIPLEEYAYQQEFACALLIGLLDPLLKKHKVNLSETVVESKHADEGGDDKLNAAESVLEGLSISDASKPSEDAAKESADDANEKTEPSASAESEGTQTAKDVTATTDGSSEQLYGEVITTMVQALWRQYKDDADAKVKAKIDEKQRQVTARVEAVQELRTRAIEAIIDAYVVYGAVSTMHSCANRDELLLLMQ